MEKERRVAAEGWRRTLDGSGGGSRGRAAWASGRCDFITRHKPGRSGLFWPLSPLQTTRYRREERARECRGQPRKCQTMDGEDRTRRKQKGTRCVKENVQQAFRTSTRKRIRKGVA